LADLGVEGVKLHQLSVIRGTPLEEAWRGGSLEVLSEDDYVERAAGFVRRLPPGTVVHRLVGDAIGDRLLAPRFDKGRAVRRIREALGARG
jgi:radical SAM superfamily enzyme